MFYAHIDENSTVIAVSQLSGVVDSPWLIPIEGYDTSLIGKRHEGGQWITPPPPAAPAPDIPAGIAASRYAREVAGIQWRGYGIATDRDSQAKILAEDIAVSSGIRVDGKGWKCLDLSTGAVTFRATSNTEMQEISRLAYGYVSGCFAREEALLASLATGAYSDAMLQEGWPSQQVA